MSGQRPSRPSGGAWGRSGTAFACVAVVGLVTLGGLRLMPAGQTRAADATVSAPTVALQATCPGTLVLPDVTGSKDSAFDPVPVAPVTEVSAVALAPASGAAALRALDGSATATLAAGGGALHRGAISGAQVLRVEPGSGGDSLAAGATVTTVTDGDLRGLSAASCQRATADQWLVGGSTDDGATALLVLTNAGATTATVTWAAWGPTGAVDLTQDRVAVAARSSTTINLAGAGGAQRSLVLHVTSAGGQVAASVQDERLDGYTPTGTDLVSASAGPATRQVVPGLLLDDSAVGDAGQAVLTLLDPGSRDTTATISLLGSDGPVDLPGADSVALTAGQVLDVPLGGVPAGRYTVVVDAAQPVLAAASFARVGQAGELDPVPRIDRADAASTSGGEGLVAVPADLDATFVVGAVGSGTDPTAGVTAIGTVQVIGTAGQVLVEHTLSVDAGTTGAWTLADLLAGADRASVAGLRVVGGTSSTGAGSSGSTSATASPGASSSAASVPSSTTGTTASSAGAASPGGPTSSASAGPTATATDASTASDQPTPTSTDGATDGSSAGDQADAATSAAPSGLWWALVLTRTQTDGTLVSLLDPVSPPTAIAAQQVREDPRIATG